MTLQRIARLSAAVSIDLAICLPFTIPFGGARNIDMQGLLLLVSGGFALIAIATQYKLGLWPLGIGTKTVLCLFLGTCLISSVTSPHLSYNLLGAPYIRLGVAGFLACVCFGVMTAQLSTLKLTRAIYASILAIATISIPYSLIKFGSLYRFGGVFAQADIMACFLGCGLLLGPNMIKMYPKYRTALIAIQLVLLTLLLLSETRAVIMLVLLISIVLLYKQKIAISRRYQIVILFIGIIGVIGVAHILPSRVTNWAYAEESLHYRTSIQAYALQASLKRPLWGYGLGNVADALDCKKLSDKDLRRTCHQGYFFNSSHNIFFDRFLAVGWLGGLCFLLLVMLALFRASQTTDGALIYPLLLITGYYFTNVTSVVLELLLWVLIIKCLASSIVRTVASRV